MFKKLIKLFFPKYKIDTISFSIDNLWSDIDLLNVDREKVICIVGGLTKNNIKHYMIYYEENGTIFRTLDIVDTHHKEMILLYSNDKYKHENNYSLKDERIGSTEFDLMFDFKSIFKCGTLLVDSNYRVYNSSYYNLDNTRSNIEFLKKLKD